LEVLFEKVLDHARGILDLPELRFDGQVFWTHRIVTGWYAKANWQDDLSAGSGTIRVNCLLDSPDVTSDTIVFLLWHEYLHLYLRQGHTPIFRALERKWPTMLAAERELHTLREK